MSLLIWYLLWLFLLHCLFWCFKDLRLVVKAPLRLLACHRLTALFGCLTRWLLPQCLLSSVYVGGMW